MADNDRDRHRDAALNFLESVNARGYGELSWDQFYRSTGSRRFKGDGHYRIWLEWWEQVVSYWSPEKKPELLIRPIPNGGLAFSTDAPWERVKDKLIVGDAPTGDAV